jgi:hypothetical protein
MWAWAPMSEAGPFLFSGDEEAYYRGRWFAPMWRFAFFALGNQHTSCMTCGTGPRVIAGSPWCASGEISCGILGREQESLLL